MHVMFRLPLLLPGVLLLAAAPFAFAESPLPDPVPPAVVGRPLPLVLPWRMHPQKPVAAKPVRPRHATARPAPGKKVVRRHAPATQARATTPPADGQGTQRAAKRALDDRIDPHMPLDDVGKGVHLARKPLGTGAYFGDGNRAAARKYFDRHPVSAAAVDWQVGEPVPRGVPLAPVPGGLLASLPRVPPGHRYVQLGGDVVLIASGSKMVVDGISRNPR